MDEWTRRGVVSLTPELVEVQRHVVPTPNHPIASTLWHIISPVICGQIEVEGDKEIFCPRENRWMLQCWRRSQWLFLFSLSWRAHLLDMGWVSCIIMDSWWLAITAHFLKMTCHFFLLYNDREQADCLSWVWCLLFCEILKVESGSREFLSWDLLFVIKDSQ